MLLKKDYECTCWVFLWLSYSRWRLNPVPFCLWGMTTAQIPHTPAGLAMTASNRKTTHGTQQHTRMKTHQWTAGQERVSLGGMGEYTGKNSHRWRMQHSGMCCHGGKGKKYLNVNLSRWISQSGQRAPCLCPLGPHPSLALSDLWITPLPQSCFSLLVQEFVGRLLKNKIKHSYLQTVIRRRTWDACVYTAFTDWARLVELIIG